MHLYNICMCALCVCVCVRACVCVRVRVCKYVCMYACKIPHLNKMYVTEMSFYSLSGSNTDSGHTWLGVTPNISCNMNKVQSQYLAQQTDHNFNFYFKI